MKDKTIEEILDEASGRECKPTKPSKKESKFKFNKKIIIAIVIIAILIIPIKVFILDKQINGSTISHERISENSYVNVALLQQETIVKIGLPKLKNTELSAQISDKITITALESNRVLITLEVDSSSIKHVNETPTLKLPKSNEVLFKEMSGVRIKVTFDKGCSEDIKECYEDALDKAKLINYKNNMEQIVGCKNSHIAGDFLTKASGVLTTSEVLGIYKNTLTKYASVWLSVYSDKNALDNDLIEAECKEDFTVIINKQTGDFIAINELTYNTSRCVIYTNTQGGN